MKKLFVVLIALCIFACENNSEKTLYHWEFEVQCPGTYKFLYSTNKDENVFTKLSENDRYELYTVTIPYETDGKLGADFNEYIKYLKIYTDDSVFYEKNNPPEADWEYHSYYPPLYLSTNRYALKVWYTFNFTNGVIIPDTLEIP